MTVQDVVKLIDARILEIEVYMEEMRNDGSMWDDDWFIESGKKRELIALRDSILEGIRE